MINVQDFIERENLFKKFKVDELLFTEIICPVEEDETSGELWWHDHFFAYAMAGEMVLKTLKGEYIFKEGDCIFAKKGSLISARHLVQGDFCELRVFLTDDFIKSVVKKHRLVLSGQENSEGGDSIIPLAKDEIIDAYFHSLFNHFNQSLPPPDSLLKLKFEELLLHVLSAQQHKPVQYFVYGICQSARPSIPEIMETNFIKNLSISEFACLCGRSLSSFKSDFQKTYHTSPGKWLREKRLDYGRFLLETTDKQVDGVCYDCGFENRSHFSRVFKDKFGLPPGKYKMEHRFLNKQNSI